MNKFRILQLSYAHVWMTMIVAGLTLGSIAFAQIPRLSPNDTLHSVVIGSDGRVTFSLYAPSADSVKIGGSDIPEQLRSAKMRKEENGVWSATIGPVPAGAYRYNFIVNEIQVVDPRNPSVSESNMNSWSLMYVPGAEFMEMKDVPHGAIAEITYYSHSLTRFRRMHVYTPPGYEAGAEKYPVFYLLHGAWDSDDAWTTVGRAGFILDNLIAQKKALPMIVVMPAGHTGPFPSFTPQPGPRRDEFVEDFLADIKPYIEKNYRALNDREHRAIAGLSMGGSQTLNIAIPHLSDYACIGVYSSGVLELAGRGPFQRAENEQPWETRNGVYLDDSGKKAGLKLFWFATGKDDFLLGISRSTVDMLKRHGFTVEYLETGGAHTWANWREYLAQFAPRLFK
jgi:enterochelin esterase-like enzyme